MVTKHRDIFSGLLAGVAFVIIYLTGGNFLFGLLGAVVVYVIGMTLLFPKRTEAALRFDPSDPMAIQQALKRAEAGLTNFRQLSAQCQKPEVRAKSMEVYNVGVKILQSIQEDKTRFSQCANFLNYYLPNLVDAMKNYRQIEYNDLHGEDSQRFQQKLEDFFGQALEGFNGILENIYRGETLDNSVEIDVMLASLKSEGLIQNDDFNLKGGGK